MIHTNKCTNRVPCDADCVCILLALYLSRPVRERELFLRIERCRAICGIETRVSLAIWRTRRTGYKQVAAPSVELDSEWSRGCTDCERALPEFAVVVVSEWDSAFWW